MKRLSLVLIIAFSSVVGKSYSNDVFAKAAGIATWAVVAPTASFIMNTTPAFWQVGAALLGRDIVSRAAAAGIISGTIGTVAGFCVYKKLSNKK